MKSLYLIPLLFLSACSTAPKLVLRPQPSPPINADAIRYPEIVRAYHFGRYVDPHDGLVMHEQHTVFRVEENTRWDLQPLRAATIGCAPISVTTTTAPHDVAFSPLPVNDAVLAEVNAQRLATAQIIMQSRMLSSVLAQFQTALSQTKTNLQETAILRATVSDIKHRLASLETAPEPFPASPISTTNEPPDSLSP